MAIAIQWLVRNFELRTIIAGIVLIAGKASFLKIFADIKDKKHPLINAVLAQGMYLMNVYEIFKVPGRLFAFSLSLCRIFLRDSHTFSKKFFVPVPENKKAPTAPV